MSERNWKLVANDDLALDHPLVQLTLQYAQRFHNSATLKEVSFFQDPAMPVEWEYTAEAEDGRAWRQRILFGAPPQDDPPMTFDVEDGWRLSEFSGGRDLRNSLVQMVVAHGLTHFSIEWK